MSVSKEAIEAAWDAYQKFGWSTQEGMKKAIEAALPFLPIAGEGKVKALDWEGSGTWNVAATVVGRYVVRPCLATNYDGQWLMRLPEKETSDLYPSEAEAKRAAQTDYETRILSALISSPGKDGGQEVEAAEWQGRYWIEEENRWSNWITNPVGYPWAHEPQEGKSEIRYLYPHPASTALVEAASFLAHRLDDFRQKIDDIDDEIEFEGKIVPALDLLRAALSAFQSTSREGER